jgi:hypothetical protein
MNAQQVSEILMAIAIGLILVIALVGLIVPFGLGLLERRN